MIKLYDEIASVNNLGDVRYDRDQKYMTEKDKERARDNIGIGEAVKRELEEVLFANLPIDAKTLRFSFGDLEYNPTTAPDVNGVSPKGAHNGTWTKLTTRNANIWDYTVPGNTLSKEWNGGINENGNCWADVEKNPIKIINSNLDGITVMDRFLQRSYAITEIWKLDVSGVTGSTAFLFSQLRNCTVFPDVLDFTNNTSSDWSTGMFQRCDKMKVAPKLLTEGAHSSPAVVMFGGCFSLQYVPYFNMSYITQLQNFMMHCFSLTNDSIAELDFSELPASCTDANHAFAGLNQLDTIPPSLPLSQFVNLDGFGDVDSAASGYDDYPPSYTSFKTLPNMNLTVATNVKYAFDGNLNLQVIPEIICPAVTNVECMFANCKNIEAGMLRLYSYLKSLGSQIKKHDNCFTNCGIDTESGKIERRYIPQSWGGDGPEE